MNHRRLSHYLLVVLACVGCNSSGISAPRSDAGAADTVQVPDLATPKTDVAPGPDTVDVVGLADAFVPGADSLLGPDLQGRKEVFTDSVGAPEVQAKADVGVPDLTILPDRFGSAEANAKPDVSTEETPPELPDTKPSADERVDLGLDSVVDLAGPGIDTGSAEVMPLPKDVTIYAVKDLAPADAKCVAAAPGWVEVVATFLSEDQKCWADSDCNYVSFSDSCGFICVLPMNKQRIGEFYEHTSGYASTNCSTCPTVLAFPACTPPTDVYCNAGRCEYRK